MNLFKPKVYSFRKHLIKQKDIAKMTNFYNRSLREPIPAEKRREVLKRAKNKCQHRGCNIKEGGDIKLHIHHKNQINSDNRLSNLIVLCPTHHGVIHKREKKVIKRDSIGRQISSRVIKKTALKKTTKKLTKKKSLKRKKRALSGTGMFNTSYFRI